MALEILYRLALVCQIIIALVCLAGVAFIVGNMLLAFAEVVHELHQYWSPKEYERRRHDSNQ